MKAAVLHEVNQPLVIEDVSVPNPGPREVLIRTRCRRCWATSPPAWSRRSAPM